MFEHASDSRILLKLILKLKPAEDAKAQKEASTKQHFIKISHELKKGDEERVAD